MSGRYLLLISLGPVQDFIAQARRSRDLWFGSHLLSELSRTAARRLAEDRADLIFPTLLRGDPELEPCDEPTRDSGKPPVSVANKILAELQDGSDPRACAEAARAAVRGRWREIAGRVYRERSAVLARGIDEVWNEQVEDILEFYAVWVPFGDDYAKARQAAEQALAGRRNLRDFRPWHHDRKGAPKSSLDGARVSVLAGNRSDRQFRRLRIGDGEQLDAIGLIKRAGFEPEQFVPLVNIAAGMWLAQAAEAAPDALAKLHRACGEAGIHRVDRDLPAVKPLRFDASVLYPARWASTFDELDPSLPAAAAESWGDTHVRPLLKAMADAPPVYVACLAADGDHMGKALNNLASAEENREFSRRLAGFPPAARDIVERKHRGSLIYAGGDDVLAFLPVATAPDCAAELAQEFRRLMAEAAPSGEAPTLSVGIGIGHFMEQMSVLLDLARRAEKAAKNAGRNALSVIFDKRSGGERSLAMQWNEKPKPAERLQKDVKLLKMSLSAGKVHELEALVRRFPDPERGAVEADAAAALACYAEQALRHTGDSKAARLCDLGIAPSSDYREFRRALVRAIDRVLLVRSLREAGFR